MHNKMLFNSAVRGALTSTAIGLTAYILSYEVVRDLGGSESAANMVSSLLLLPATILPIKPLIDHYKRKYLSGLLRKQ